MGFLSSVLMNAQNASNTLAENHPNRIPVCHSLSRLNVLEYETSGKERSLSVTLSMAEKAISDTAKGHLVSPADYKP